MSWKCGQWNSAISKKHRIECKICMELKRGTLSMRAWDCNIDGSHEYTVCVYNNVDLSGVVSKTFYNKIEANSFWVIMRRKYFGEPYINA